MTMEVGQTMWWRGMRMEIFAVNKERGVFRYASVNALIEEPDWVSRDGKTTGRTLPAYVVTSNSADAKWHPQFELWYMDGVSGEMPAFNKDGDLIDPVPPSCEKCGAVTFRVSPCTNCRKEALESEGVI